MGDFIVRVFSLHNITDMKSSFFVDTRLVGEPKQSPRVKGNPNPAINLGYTFRVRKQAISIRFEVIKPGTFSDTSVGSVEVPCGNLVAGIPADMVLTFGKSGIQLHVDIMFVPDLAFQRDLLIQKALQQTGSGDFAGIVATGGSSVMGGTLFSRVCKYVNRSLNMPTQSGVVVMNQQPQVVPAQVQVYGAPAVVQGAAAPQPMMYQSVHTSQQHMMPMQGQPMQMQQHGQPMMQQQGQSMQMQMQMQPQQPMGQPMMQMQGQPMQMQDPYMMQGQPMQMQGQPMQQQQQPSGLYPSTAGYSTPANLTQ